MAKVMELRSLIYGKFDSESQLADKLGWPRQKLNRITNGLREPDIYEVADLATALDEPVNTILDIFLQRESPVGQPAGDRP